MQITRRHALALAGAPLLAGPAIAAPRFPERQVTLVVPLAPGGGSDTQARVLARGLYERLGHPFIVVNRPGANGYVGAQFVNDARPDGHTLMLQSAGSFILAAMMRRQSLDPMADFVPVAQIGELATSIMVKADGPYRTLADLLADARARPGMLRWSHNGRGSFHHVAGVGFGQVAGLRLRDVPFDGGGPSRAAVIGGTVEFGFLGIQQVSGFEAALRILGVVSETRDPLLGEVPTLLELGLRTPLVTSPTVLYAPKGTPPDLTAQIAQEVATVVGSEAYRAEVARLGLAPVFRDATATRAYLERLRAEAEPIMAELRMSAPR
jgi:tripartite-type tricarboxylate transporter receptor subunit TctC